MSNRVNHLKNGIFKMKGIQFINYCLKDSEIVFYNLYLAVFVNFSNVRYNSIAPSLIVGLFMIVFIVLFSLCIKIISFDISKYQNFLYMYKCESFSMPFDHKEKR